MKKCKICKNELLIGDSFCNECGFSDDSNTVIEKSLTQQYYRKLKKGEWSEEISFVKRLHQNLTKYNGDDMAKLLGIKSRSTVSQDVRLAEGILEFPYLKKIRSKKRAFAKYKNGDIFQLFEYEEDLHKFLYNNWDILPLLNKWHLYKTGSSIGKYDTKEIGEIDLLAQNEKGNKWLVVELKREETSDDTIGQLLRYMGWVKKKLAKKQDCVEGLIICGGYNNKMDYALECVKQINAKIYRRFGNQSIKFYPFEKSFNDSEAQALNILESLAPEIQKKILANYNKPKPT